MGRVSLAQILQEQFGNPDDAVPISTLRMPVAASVMRSGFSAGSQRDMVFEGETAVSVRVCERVWRYVQLPGAEVKTDRRWRLEIGVMASQGPIQPWHKLVVAQEPYGNAWQQCAAFKPYSKKGQQERALPEVPTLTGGQDPIEWLERHVRHDPWEKNNRLIAGISHPHGFMSDEPRNSAGDLILGVCPDFDSAVDTILRSDAIQSLLEQTRKGTIVFWHPRVTSPPALYPEMVEECELYMGTAIRQALAGPWDAPDRWMGKPVSALVSKIYRDHLNMRNRAEQRRRGREGEDIGSAGDNRRTFKRASR